MFFRILDIVFSLLGFQSSFGFHFKSVWISRFLSLKTSVLYKKGLHLYWEILGYNVTGRDSGQNPENRDCPA